VHVSPVTVQSAFVQHVPLVMQEPFTEQNDEPDGHPQTPLALHVWPDPHATHVAPAVPQEFVD